MRYGNWTWNLLSIMYLIGCVVVVTFGLGISVAVGSISNIVDRDFMPHALLEVTTYLATRINLAFDPMALWARSIL